MGRSTGVCSRLGFPLGPCGVQGGFLGRQHIGSTAGDCGVDEVHQSVGLVTALEGEPGCHMGAESQQPAVHEKAVDSMYGDRSAHRLVLLVANIMVFGMALGMEHLPQ